MNFKEFLHQGEQLDLADKTQIKTDDLMGAEITITAAAIATGDKGEYSICICKEHPENFFFASSILTRQIKEILADKVATKSMQDGEFRVIMTKRKNKDGSRTYTDVEVLD